MLDNILPEYQKYLMRSKSTDFSRWWGMGAKAPHLMLSTNKVGGNIQENIEAEATDEVGGDSLKK